MSKCRHDSLSGIQGQCHEHISALTKEVENLRLQHKAWTDSFGTTQLTHAKAKMESTKSLTDKLAGAVTNFLEIGRLHQKEIAIDESTVEELLKEWKASK